MKITGIFKTTCPTGWTRVSAWDGKYLRGNAAYGGAGGTVSHTHKINFPSTYTTIGASDWGSVSGASPSTNTNGHLKTHYHQIDPNEFDTASSANDPTYVAVVYCSKEDS